MPSDAQMIAVASRITQLDPTGCKNEPMAPPEGDHGEHPVAGMLGSVYEQLRRIEELVVPDVKRDVSSIEARAVPAWKRATEGEHRLPVVIAVALAIALQLVLPNRLVIGPPWLFPSLEGLLLIGLIAANPRRINRTSTLLRTGSVLLIALFSLANAWSSAELIRGIVNSTSGDNNASVLLARGASIYVTNIIVFGLWYWEWDRGGPVARARGERPYPDFQFPQMVQQDLASSEWQPNFIDYLYVSFTNAVAFSPTDTMPLTRWAKMLMLIQASVALLTVAFVIARAVNILK